MKPFSICMIVKNEEKRIERCLSAASQLKAEIVVVDTGSTDRTKELAAKYTEQIYDFEWCKDFSKARNFSIEKASHDWILVLDCDEYVEKFDLKQIDEFLDPIFYGHVGAILRRNQIAGENVCMEDWVPRFFHRKYYKYEGSIHEQVVHKKGKDYSLCEIPITVYHDGYVGSIEDIKAKAIRNETMLLEDLKTNPNKPYVYFQLGQAASLVGDSEKACNYYEQALTYDVDPQFPYVQRMIISYGETLLDLKEYEKALQLKGIYDEFATTSDFLCLMGLIYIRNNMPVNAILEFMKALTVKEHFREDTGNTFPRYHIGMIYEAMGDIKNAVMFYESCGNYEPAKRKLAAIQNAK